MTTFTMTTTLDGTYDETVQRVRDLLPEAGFGILTEIDLKETLHAKLGVEVQPQVILGACRPQLAHQALEADPRLAAMLPCNVVVAAQPDGTTRVDVFDPVAMTSFSDAPGVAAVAAEARDLLAGMLAALDGTSEDSHAARR